MTRAGRAAGTGCRAAVPRPRPIDHLGPPGLRRAPSRRRRVQRHTVGVRGRRRCRGSRRHGDLVRWALRTDAPAAHRRRQSADAVPERDAHPDADRPAESPPSSAAPADALARTAAAGRLAVYHPRTLGRWTLALRGQPAYRGRHLRSTSQRAASSPTPSSRSGSTCRPGLHWTPRREVLTWTCRPTARPRPVSGSTEYLRSISHGDRRRSTDRATLSHYVPGRRPSTGSARRRRRASPATAANPSRRLRPPARTTAPARLRARRCPDAYLVYPDGEHLSTLRPGWHAVPRHRRILNADDAARPTPSSR